MNGFSFCMKRVVDTTVFDEDFLIEKQLFVIAVGKPMVQKLLKLLENLTPDIIRVQVSSSTLPV